MVTGGRLKTLPPSHEGTKEIESSDLFFVSCLNGLQRGLAYENVVIDIKGVLREWLTS